MKIDLHGYELWEAVEELIQTIEECKIKGDCELEVVHGYKHGQVLKNYLRSEGFIMEMGREGHKLKKNYGSNPGTSKFEIIK